MGECPASLPSGNGNEQSPGLCRCRSHGSWANRSASRPRRSRCQLKRRWHWFTVYMTPTETFDHKRRSVVMSAQVWHTWVWDHQKDAVGAVLHDVGNDELEDVDVPLDEVQAALALLLTGSSGHNDHFGVCSHAVVWKSHGMINLGKILRSLSFYIPVKHSLKACSDQA